MSNKKYIINEITVRDSWRMFHILAEFVEGFEALAECHPSVTIFGSSRAQPQDEVYQKAERIGQLLAENGFGVITGGGPGVMEAANKGAGLAGGKSIGLNIQIPLEQEPNPYANIKLNFRYFFVRKVMFVNYADALALQPDVFAVATSGTLNQGQQNRLRVFLDKRGAMPVDTSLPVEQLVPAVIEAMLAVHRQETPAIRAQIFAELTA